MRKVCIILLIFYFLGLLTFLLIVGWDSYFHWWRHHTFAYILCEVIGLLLAIGAFSSDKEKNQ